jgi:hypothetical protein
MFSFFTIFSFFSFFIRVRQNNAKKKASRMLQPLHLSSYPTEFGAGKITTRSEQKMYEQKNEEERGEKDK